MNKRLCRTGPFEYYFRSFSLTNTALVLMDVWEGPLKPTKQNIARLADECRKRSVPIVHVLNQHRPDRSIYSPDEPTMSCKEELSIYLLGRKINKLLYAGFSVDECILFRPTGIANMGRLGFTCIIVRDCTEGSEFPDEPTPIAWKVGVRIIETSFGGSIELNDILEEPYGQN